jgi:hypothetical protein
VALDRGLYADFTQPAESGIVLDPWRLIAMLGAVLLNESPDGDDLVWDLLESLAAPSEADFDRDWLPWIRDLGRELGTEFAHMFDCTPDESGGVLIRRHATVLVSATRVDVYLRLNELSVEIRLAGIDRDPGWVPAAARVVAFHFD